VAERVRADPDVLPRGRDAKLVDPLEYLRLVDLALVRVEILEALAASTAPDSRLRAV
jgi:hypothetical protein